MNTQSVDPEFGCLAGRHAMALWVYIGPPEGNIGPGAFLGYHISCQKCGDYFVSRSVVERVDEGALFFGADTLARLRLKGLGTRENPIMGHHVE